MTDSKNEIIISYKSFTINKKNGKKRIIYVPNDNLKKYQQILLTELFYRKDVLKNIVRQSTAFKPHVSILKNVTPHLKRKYILSLDIEDFFNSINSVKINTLLKDFFNENELNIITTYCLFQDKLPQGSPTSPIISNLILSNFDKELIKIIHEINYGNIDYDKVRYTRYADDITISGNEEIFSFIKIIQKKLNKYGFKINKNKTRIYKSHERQIVTGLIVNKKINVPNEYYKKIRQELYYIGKFGFENHSKKIKLKDISFESYMESLIGKVNYISKYSKERKLQLEKLLSKF